MREICTSGLIRGGCREAIAYFLVAIAIALGCLTAMMVGA